VSSTPAEGTTPGKADMTQPAAAPCGVSSPLKRPLQVIRAVHIHWRPVGLSPGLNELQIPGFTGPMRLTRLGRLIRLVVPRGPSPSPTSPEKWWCKWWCICRVPSPRSQCWQAFLKAVQRTPSPYHQGLAQTVEVPSPPRVLVSGPASSDAALATKPAVKEGAGNPAASPSIRPRYAVHPGWSRRPSLAR